MILATDLRKDNHSDPLGANSLPFANNPEWRMLRTKLTPVFTSGKMKQMFPLIDNVSFISGDRNILICIPSRLVKD